MAPSSLTGYMAGAEGRYRQIERVFKDMGETIHRSQSGSDLMAQLAQPNPRLLGSLVHKFGRRDVEDFETFLRDLTTQPSQTQGEIYVFVDECHRTQGGKLHRVMKAMMAAGTAKESEVSYAGTTVVLDMVLKLDVAIKGKRPDSWRA